MVPACKISAKSVQPFLSYAGDRHTDRQTFKNITSLAEVINMVSVRLLKVTFGIDNVVSAPP